MIYMLECTTHKKYFPLAPIKIVTRHWKRDDVSCIDCKAERQRLYHGKKVKERKVNK